MKVAVNLLWVLLALFAALALAHVVGVVNPNEKVNGLWLVVAAACIYVLALPVLWPMAGKGIRGVAT